MQRSQISAMSLPAHQTPPKDWKKIPILAGHKMIYQPKSQPKSVYVYHIFQTSGHSYLSAKIYTGSPVMEFTFSVVSVYS